MFTPIAIIPKTSLPQFLARFVVVFACVAALLFSACGCAQGQSNSQEGTSSTSSASSVSEDSSDETFADVSPDDLAHSESSSSASSASSASASSVSSASSSAAHTASTPLEKAWEADFKRLAKASGMDVSVSASGGTFKRVMMPSTDKRSLILPDSV